MFSGFVTRRIRRAGGIGIASRPPGNFPEPVNPPISKIFRYRLSAHIPYRKYRIAVDKIGAV